MGPQNDATGAVDWPPPELTPAELLTAWLPDRYARLGIVAPDDAPIVRLTLSGDGGGDFVIRAAGDSLDVSAYAPQDGVDVWIRQRAADFRAVYAGDPDLPELVPGRRNAADVLGVDVRDAEMVRQIAGRVLLELEGRRRRRWALDLAFGASGLGAGRPRSTVRIDGATYEGILAKRVAPLQALVERKVTVEGDRALAMQLLLLLASRINR